MAKKRLTGKPTGPRAQVTAATKRLRRDTEQLEAKVKTLRRSDADKLKGIEKGRK